jgi:hypothetical protein
MKRYILLLIAFTLLFSGCAKYSTRPDAMASPEYQSREAIAESLFKGDQAVLSNEDIEKILSSKITLPAKAKVAILRFTQREPWAISSDEMANLDENVQANFISKLASSTRVRDVAFLPSLLTPKDMTVPKLREAAARFQADLLLVYRTGSHAYSRQKVFSPDETRAYCVVEAVLLDVRTGIVAFSSLVTENYTAKKAPGEVNFSETIQKAEQEAIGRALGKIANDLAAFLNAVP